MWPSQQNLVFASKIKGGEHAFKRRQGLLAQIAWLTLSLAILTIAVCPQEARAAQTNLKDLSLQELGNVEVTNKSKAPEQVWTTAAAIFVITQDDIRRSGATSITEALRLAPGVEVARISGDQWPIGIRGFGSRLARSVLVLIDGRSVYMGKRSIAVPNITSTGTMFLPIPRATCVSPGR